MANGNTESTTVTGGNMRDTPFETRGAHFHWGYNDHQGEFLWEQIICTYENTE